MNKANAIAFWVTLVFFVAMLLLMGADLARRALDT
jgi:hypothetical protein